MDRPLSTAPLPVTFTEPSGALCQPGPLETWPGTAFRVIPEGTPVVVPSGKPHTCGTAAHPACTDTAETGRGEGTGA